MTDPALSGVCSAAARGGKPPTATGAMKTAKAVERAPNSVVCLTKEMMYH